MNDKFTPGPWSATESAPAEGYHVFWISAPQALGPHNGEKDICSVPGRDVGNARLIAAAPELYGAAKALEEHMLFNVAPSAGIVAMFRDAIAKVEGTTP